MGMKHFIFDLDGTLWNTTEITAQAYNHALREDGRSSLLVTPDLIKQEFGKTMSVIADDLFPELEKEDRDGLLDLCSQANTAFLEETGQDILYPGVKETLVQLSKLSRLYIVSNCQTGYIEMFVRKYGLQPYITDTECFGRTGMEKAESIALLMKRNGISEAAYVGDTAGDYDSATKAGIPFIFASYGYGEIRQSAHSISRFSQLLDYALAPFGLSESEDRTCKSI